MTKADEVRRFLEASLESIFEVSYRSEISFAVIIEEPLVGFRAGKSSAGVLAILNKFNGIVSYLIHQITGAEPRYVMSGHARKLCGVKVTSKKKSPDCINQKDQVFKQLSPALVIDNPWLIDASGKATSGAQDAVDAYVVALSYVIEPNPPLKTKRPRKPHKTMLKQEDFVKT